MTDQELGRDPYPPDVSKAKLAWVTLAALTLAGVVLITVVLPAEYDIDLLGTGETLGLVVLSGAEAPIPVRSDGISPQESTYHVDRKSFVLGPEEFVEYKYRLEAGQAMLYSWEASYWVRSEMHAEVDGSPPGTAEFFEVAERTLFRNGSYTAPFPGIHGWYWMNESTTDTVTVTLHASGFFQLGVEFRDSVAPIPMDITETPQDQKP